MSFPLSTDPPLALIVAFISSVLGTAFIARKLLGAGSRSTSDRSHGTKVFRITGVPLGWDQAALLRFLGDVYPSLNEWGGTVTLYPGLRAGASQVALLNLGNCPQHLEKLTEWSVKSKSDSEVELSVDSHFNNLTPLNAPDGKIVADIVAVTGLAGHAYGSWKHRESQRMWLKDFLPRDLKNVRIMTYGYDTKLDRIDDTSSLLDLRRNLIEQLGNARQSEEEKKRPLIFLGHSLGGVLILQALIQCKTRSANKDLLESIFAIFFFGTPHQGLRTKELEAMVKDLSAGAETSRLKLLFQLAVNSDYLQEQSESVVEMLKNVKIVSFYETETTQTVRKIGPQKWDRSGPAAEMVTKMSAQRYLPNEILIAVHRNHTDIVKFRTGEDECYITVLKYIRECLQALETHRGERAQKHRRKYISWLSPTDPLPGSQKNLSQKAEGTCQWIFENSTYREWVNPAEERHLWVKGRPGAGKSVLSATVLSNLLSANETGSQVLYFFFRTVIKQRQMPPKWLQVSLPSW